MMKWLTMVCVRGQMSHSVMMTSLLNELRGGEFDGWTREDIKTKRPDVWDARQLDKLNYRCEQGYMRSSLIK